MSLADVKTTPSTTYTTTSSNRSTFNKNRVNGFTALKITLPNHGMQSWRYFCNRAKAVFSNRAQRNTPVTTQATTQTAVAAEQLLLQRLQLRGVTYSYAGGNALYYIAKVVNSH